MKKLFWFVIGRLAQLAYKVIFSITTPVERRHINAARYGAHGHCHGPYALCKRWDCRVTACLDRLGYAALYLWRDCPASWR